MSPSGLTATLEWTSENGETIRMGTVSLSESVGMHNETEVVLAPSVGVPWIVVISMRAATLFREDKRNAAP